MSAPPGRPRSGARPGRRARGAEAEIAVLRSVPDGMPFDGATRRPCGARLSNHLDKFFRPRRRRGRAPEGKFPGDHKCGVTGELLGRRIITAITRSCSSTTRRKLPRMAFDMFKSRIETIRDPEPESVAGQDEEGTRYTWKNPPGRIATAKPAAETAALCCRSNRPLPPPVAESTGDAGPRRVPTAARAPLPHRAAAAVPPAEATPVAPAEARRRRQWPTFENLEERACFCLNPGARKNVVRAVEPRGSTRRGWPRRCRPAKMPPRDSRAALSSSQQRFPLDTAKRPARSAARGEHLHDLQEREAPKGISNVLARWKGNSGVPGQTSPDSIGGLISFMRDEPGMIQVLSELQVEYPPSSGSPRCRTKTGPRPRPRGNTTPRRVSRQRRGRRAPAPCAEAAHADRQERAKLSPAMQGDSCGLSRSREG